MRRFASLLTIRFQTALVGALAFALALPLAFPESAEAQRRGIPINIESVPAGATVYVDSPDTPALGTTPMSSVRVPSGTHVLIFRLANHEEARLNVNVRRRRETFRAVLRALGTIEVSAGNQNARGATVRVDGALVGGGILGSVPIRVNNLQPGRHQVQAEREGYVTFEQWVEVQGGQAVRMPIVMEAAAPDTGSILVSATPGAEVFLDGEARGTAPTVLDGVTVGNHQVEIRVSGSPPYTQQVGVLAGQRVTVNAPIARGGTLRVLTSAPAAVIAIDGEAVGPSPAVREGLTPGEHIVTVTAEGYQRAQQTVTVSEGQQRVISVEMTREVGANGGISVQANVPGARVLIDNEEVGQVPYVTSTPPPAGQHAIVVRAPGHQEFSQVCTTGPDQSCEINATLHALQVRVSVGVQDGIVGAEFYFDGELQGPVPWEGNLPAGSHMMELRAPGFQLFQQQTMLEPQDETRAFSVDLIQEIDHEAEERAADAERRRRELAAAVTHSAVPLPVNQASVDFSLGWPYAGEVRFNIGIHEFLDAGFSIRSFGRLTDFEGRVRSGYRIVPQFAIGGQLRFGGGIGPSWTVREPTYAATVPDGMGGTRAPQLNEERYFANPNDVVDGTGAQVLSQNINSGFFSLELLASLIFGDVGGATFWFALDYSSDQYPAHPGNEGAWLQFNAEGQQVCDTMSSISEANCPREEWARGRFGGIVELVVHPNWNIWALLEGIVSAQERRVYGSIFGLDVRDTQFYFRLGATYKFDDFAN